MKTLNLESINPVELSTNEMTHISGGGGLGIALLEFVVERAWEYRNDIIATHRAISAAYKKHPEAFLK